MHVYVPQIVASCRRRACTAWRRAHRRHAFGETGAKVTYVLSVIASLGVAAANVTFVGQTIVSLLEANGFTADEVPPPTPGPIPCIPSTARPSPFPPQAPPSEHRGACVGVSLCPDPGIYRDYRVFAA